MVVMPFDIWWEMLHPWANPLEHVARGQGNDVGRHGEELGIDQACETWNPAYI